MPAVIFDMDGVLIDSEPLWQRAEVEVFSGLGVPITQEMCTQTTGLRIREAVGYWHERFPWADASIPEVASGIVERVSELIRTEGRPILGAVDFVGRLGELDLPLALCSSSPMPLILAVVSRFGYDDAFSVLQSADDCREGKPAPDPYLATAARLDISPSACLVFEDSVTGMRSAHAAGMTVVGVTESQDEAVSELCLTRVASFEGLGPEDVRAWLDAGV